MYLPFGSAILLPLLQLPSLLWISGSPTLPFSVHGERLEGRYRRDLNYLGTLSPYHDAPTARGVSVDLPRDCTVNQVVLLHRHGSRGPLWEHEYIRELVNTLHEARNIIRAARLPAQLEFLRDGYESHLDPEQLSIVGRKELFDHGAEFALRYPTLSTDEVVSTKVQRVKDSAHFFIQGFFGRDAENIRFLTEDDFTDPVFWLNPWLKCPNLRQERYPGPMEAAERWREMYIPSIVERFNGFIRGVEFSPDDIRGALYACAYDLAARARSPWCNVFTAEELQGLEYELDLYYDGRSGHRVNGDPGPLTGAFYVKKLVERLANLTGNAKPLHLDFAHDSSILYALSAMGLNKDDEPLSPEVDRPPRGRKFRTSNQVPFAAEMIWEKFTCRNSFGGPRYPQVRLVLNNATFPLPNCAQNNQDRRYGTCSLAEFMQVNQYSRDVRYHDARWNYTCEDDH